MEKARINDDGPEPIACQFFNPTFTDSCPYILAAEWLALCVHIDQIDRPTLKFVKFDI